MSRDVEENDLRLELFRREDVAFFLDGDECRQEVVGWVIALPPDRGLDVFGHVQPGIDDRRDVFGRRDRLERPHERVRPCAQLRAIGLGHAEQLRDHEEGEREREVGDDVDGRAAAGRGVVEELVDQHLDARDERLDPPRRERLRHEPADARVVGRVEVEDRPLAAIGSLDAGGGKDQVPGVEGRVAVFYRDARLAHEP